MNNEPRVLVCIDGKANLLFEEQIYPVIKGEVVLLPAEVGVCLCKLDKKTTLLEIAIPGGLPNVAAITR